MITVGQENFRQTFIVHIGLLLHHSTFFRKILPARSHDIQHCNLPDFEASTFGIFVHYLYAQQIITASGSRLSLVSLAKLYILARNIELKLSTIEYLHDNMLSTPIAPGDELYDFQRFCYSSGVQILREIAVRKTLEVFDRDDIDEILRYMPEEMMADFLRAMMYQCVQLPGWRGGGFAGVFETIDPRTDYSLEIPPKFVGEEELADNEEVRKEHSDGVFDKEGADYNASNSLGEDDKGASEGSASLPQNGVERSIEGDLVVLEEVVKQETVALKG